MSEQNRYRIDGTYRYQDGYTEGWQACGVWPGDTWQDAIQKLLEYWYKNIDVSYQVVSEKPSEDGRSGIMEIQHVPMSHLRMKNHFQATLLENNLPLTGQQNKLVREE